jgi:preprotein translocase subunit SecF
LREAGRRLGYGEPVIQEFGAPNQVSIRVRLPEGAEDTPGAPPRSVTKVIAREIQSNIPTCGATATTPFRARSRANSADGDPRAAGAMAAISIYIWVRFEWQFGVGALFALVHDVS